ncbi:protein of unknown function [Hyphomicrobium sp. MC1]|nr:protein of unknown function [Hyphomicrobium sp. MC1]
MPTPRSKACLRSCAPSCRYHRRLILWRSHRRSFIEAPVSTWFGQDLLLLARSVEFSYFWLYFGFVELWLSQGLSLRRPSFQSIHWSRNVCHCRHWVRHVPA